MAAPGGGGEELVSTHQIQTMRRAGMHEQARELAAQLAALHPDDALVQYEAACVHDYLGQERAAVPYYRRAIAAGLPLAQLRGAYLGLGSTLRALGQYSAALVVFDEGLKHFATAPELQTFRAMTLYNLGRSKEAVAMLLGVLCATTADGQLQGLVPAISTYAEDLDRTWD
jgi:tetratricopeptide (TPR) repeat protein